jgi:LPS export ABC transporter protein LptC
MITKAVRKYAMVALSLLGSAILLFSCGSADSVSGGANNEALMTERSEDLTILMSENGRRSYHFKTPLLEGYTLAADPYREFRKGIHITTYQNDSLTTVNATLVANYAIFYEKRELWEAKGDVVVEKADGTKLYTQQLFWNSKTGRIYSNVDSKIVKGTDVFMGEGFESDEELKEWRFRRMSGKMLVNMEQTQKPDSVTKASAHPNDHIEAGAKGDGEAGKRDAGARSVSKTEKPATLESSEPRASIHKSKGEKYSSANRKQPREGVATPQRRISGKEDRLQIKKADAVQKADVYIDTPEE